MAKNYNILTCSIFVLAICVGIANALFVSVHANESQSGSRIGDEFEVEFRSHRRILATNETALNSTSLATNGTESNSTSSGFISYAALMVNSIPCSVPGASYYNCRVGAEANPYTRSCSAITRCARE